MKAFRDAIEAWDFDSIGDLLADDVVFPSSATYRPYEGQTDIATIGRAKPDGRAAAKPRPSATKERVPASIQTEALA